MEKLRQFLETITPLMPDEWSLASSLFVRMDIGKGEIFVKPDEICSKIAFIERGLFRMYYNVNGVENTTLFFSENQFVTDYFGFLTKTPSIGPIQALEDSVVYTISFNNLQKLFEYKNWERIGRIMAERAFSFSVMEANRFLHDDFETRYTTFVNENPGYVQRIPQYMIASYLKMTPETYSRVKRRVQKNQEATYSSLFETPKSKLL